MSTPTLDPTRMSTELYEAWEKSMTAWWDQVLESPGFLKAMNQGASQGAAARRRWEDSVDQTLTQLHLPTRADLTRVARIASLVEDRLLAVEDRLLAVQDQLAATERDALAARVKTAEQLVLLHDKLEALEARLAEREGE